jgi:hypothetical protein
MRRWLGEAQVLNAGELLKVTPKNIRLYKRSLNTEERGKMWKRAKEELMEGVVFVNGLLRNG